MPVILKINDRGNVRDAVPLRAIPYVTSWRDSPVDIVRALAAPKTVRVESLEKTDRYNELFAYHMDAQGHFEQVPPEQWESWVVTLDSLTKKLQADERKGAEDENWGPWRIKAVLELPDNVFVWLDEFQRWYSINRPLDVPDDYRNDCLKWESNQESLRAKRHDPNSELSESEWAMLDEPQPGLEQASDQLCLTPIFPPEIKNRLWCFDFVVASPAANAEAVPVTSPSDDGWIEKAQVIADKIGLEKYRNGIRQITARNICEAVASELELDETTWGKQGPRGADNVRNEGLRGWKFIPPKEAQKVD